MSARLSLGNNPVHFREFHLRPPHFLGQREQTEVIGNQGLLEIGHLHFVLHQVIDDARLLDIPAEDRILHPIMKLQIPRSVQIKIEMKVIATSEKMALKTKSSRIVKPAL